MKHLPILFFLLISSFSAEAQEKSPYFFDREGISRQNLEHYLNRAITFTELLVPDTLTNDGIYHGRDDDLRMLENIGAKFIGRAIYLWGHEDYLTDELFTKYARERAAKIHAIDPEIVLQAALFEIVTEKVNNVPIPASVFEEFGLPAENRCFRYEKMLSPSGKFVDHWRKGASVPDISQPETQMWFVYLAQTYFSVGCEAFHLGQVSLIGMHDPQWKHWSEFIARLRKLASSHARRGWVLLDAHTPTGGMVVEGKCLLDFHSFPLRIKEIAEKPQDGTLERGYLDALFGRSQGGIAPSGWACDSLPFLVEFDNFGITRTPGEATPGSHFIWGYDEISWFQLQDEPFRDRWLRYARTRVRELDENAFLQLPAGRITILAPGVRSRFRANTRSEAVPEGLNLEETIRDIFRAGGEIGGRL